MPESAAAHTGMGDEPPGRHCRLVGHPVPVTPCGARHLDRAGGPEDARRRATALPAARGNGWLPPLAAGFADSLQGASPSLRTREDRVSRRVRFS